MENNSEKIGLFGAINIAVGSMLGAAIYILLPKMIDGVGSAIYLAFLLGALPAVFCSVYYIQLNGIFPSSGGTYFFSKRLLGTYVGFISSLCLIFGLIGAIAMLGNGFAQYFSLYFPNIPFTVPLVGVVILFFIINYLGITTVKVIQSIMVILILVALVLFIIPGLTYKITSSGFTPANEFLPGGGGALFSASVTAFLAYGTFVFLSSLGGQIKNPKRNTPLAMIISLSLVVILYAGVAYTATMVAPRDMISQTTTALPDIASLYLPTMLSVLIGVSGLLAIATTLNTTFTVVSSELQKLSQEGHVPKFLGYTHKKYHTPTNSLLICGLLGLVLLFSGLAPGTFVHMIISGILLSTFMTGLATLRLKKKAADDFDNALFHVPLWILYPSTLIGSALSLAYAIYILYAYPTIGILLILFLSVMSGFYYVNHRNRVLEHGKKNEFGL